MPQTMIGRLSAWLLLPRGPAGVRGLRAAARRTAATMVRRLSEQVAPLTTKRALT